MTTNKKQASKRSAARRSSIDIEYINTDVLQTEMNWLNDYEFLSPNEIYMNAIGLIFNLTTKRLIHISFMNFYQRSLKFTWMNLLKRERQKLKSNINSVEKCFMINRLIAECKKDPCQFARQTGELYEEIEMRISCTISLPRTVEDFYSQVELRINLQSQRRLFHINHEEANRPLSLLALQQAATKIYSHFLNCCQQNLNKQNYDNLKKLLQHSFIIIKQPSIPECVAATKYDKSDNTYSAKLHARIICLLEPDTVKNSLQFSNVAVTLFPFDRKLDSFGEEQQALIWHKRRIIDPENVLRSFFYVELKTIELKKFDRPKSRPVYNANICQLEFQIKIRDVLPKLISQMEMFVDYPFLSMMYHDGLFLGICDNTFDQQLHGTRQRPHMLLRFNSLTEHRSIQNASVRFIVHNGQLTRATFHTKAFIDEMCQMICKANLCETMKKQFQLAITNHSFNEFNDELFRLNPTASQINDGYQPLIPVLWDTMRISTAEQLKQSEQQLTLSSSLQFDSESMEEDFSQSRTFSINEIPLEKLSDLLMNSSTSNNISISSTFLPTLTNENIEQQKKILSHLLNVYFQSKTYVDVGTQTSLPISNNSLDDIFDNT
ncbi:unnamed protein product [Rotaria sp. Silwood1]|nr:unnamed protein product [Rotaria sp. Silwood1]